MAVLASFERRLQRRLLKRFDGALAFLVATAWSRLFQDLLDVIVGDRDTIFFHVVYAVLFTVIAAYIATLSDDDD